MSIRIVTAIIPTQGSIADGAIPPFRREQHKARKAVGLAVLVAAALTANIADAARMSHYRQFRASMPENGRAAPYAPGYDWRHDRGVSAPLPVGPFSGRGIFQETNPAP